MSHTADMPNRDGGGGKKSKVPMGETNPSQKKETKISLYKNQQAGRFGVKCGDLKSVKGEKTRSARVPGGHKRELAMKKDYPIILIGVEGLRGGDEKNFPGTGHAPVGRGRSGKASTPLNGWQKGKGLEKQKNSKRVEG